MMNNDLMFTGDDQEAKENFVLQSRQKLEAVALSLHPWASSCRPCQTKQETCEYRCRCGFQLIEDNNGKVQYAIRQGHRPIEIRSFPIANRRIQKAMKGLLEALNNDKGYETLRQNVTSVSFSSSWREDATCLVTLHYDSPIEDEISWTLQAQRVCQDIGLSQCTGRSKKRFFRAIKDSDITIEDTVWLLRQQSHDWKVDLNEPDDSSKGAIAVYYSKPEGAFFHPNSRAMCSALQWMLQRLTLITEELGRKGRLLEMYCGCGAHTVALARSGLVDNIVAVELDERLVEACRVNCRRNDIEPSTVNIISHDAGKWAREPPSADFDILLVDPPRQGLDEKVCRMAIHGNIEHFLYISCGRDALVRDLDLLAEAFEVMDCTLLDLFPRTSAVESLVHLRRRQKG